MVQAANPDDAHGKLGARQELASILSHVEKRQVKNHYTVQFAVTAATPLLPLAKPASAPRPIFKAIKKSNWMKRFSIRGGHTVKEAIQIANATS